MMIIDSTAAFLSQLGDSQLLEPEQLDEVRRDLSSRSEDFRELARLLIQKNRLTPYQVQEILLGQGAHLVLGQYLILEPLGRGGAAAVFKARHRRLNRLVALKVIRREKASDDPRVIRRFQREARAAAQLSHPNIVTVYDADQVGDAFFLAMEFVEGTDLFQLVKAVGPLPVPLACDIICQAACGLQHVHERGLVHRDIKPSNLLLAKFPSPPARPPVDTPPAWQPADGLLETRLVKILDMGLARLDYSLDTALTPEDVALGSPDYVAPEQARNAHLADIRADLYSLGCTFYYLLAGQPPFPHGSGIEKFLMQLLDDPQPVEELRPEVSPAVLVIVRKLMAKRPKNRYQTPAEVVETLDLLTRTGNSLTNRG